MSGNLPVTTTTFETELQAKINTVGGSTSIEDIISYYRAGENIPTINNTALTTEVQLRLDAVSSSTTAVEFLELAASFGKISNTNQADLQSALLAIEDIPTNSELATALSPLATSAELAPLATSTDVSDSEANVISAINNQGGGLIRSFGFSGVQRIAAGSSGDILILSAPAGKYVRLDSLGVNNTNESGITITIDGNIVVDSLILEDATQSSTVDTFCVSQGGGISGINSASISLFASDLIGSTITISKDSGSTANFITYSRSYLEVL